MKMKRYLGLLFLLLFLMVFCTFDNASALSFTDSAIDHESISSNGSFPNSGDWFELDFPSSLGGIYSGGVFEYDDYLPNIDAFTITMTGVHDNYDDAVQVYLDFDTDHSSRIYVGSTGNLGSINDGDEFTVEMDVVGNSLYLDGVYKDNLNGLNVNHFLGKDIVYVGYACHFFHERSDLFVQVNSVPEPTTMLLLGTGLVGLAGFRRKFRK